MQKWNEVAAKKIAADLDDRAGFNFNGLDPGIKREILATWARIIRKALRDAKPKAGE